MTLFLNEGEGKSYFNRKQEEKKPGKKEIDENYFIPYMKYYHAKAGPPDILVANNTCKKRLKYEDVFTESEQVGIKKGREGQTEEEAYYKQVFLRMEKGFSYAFFIRLNTEWDNKSVVLKDNIISMGGERSTFKMTLKEVSKKNSGETAKELFDKILPDFTEEKIILYSDAFVDTRILSLCEFAVTESTYFRNIISDVKNTRKFYNLKPRDDESKKTPYLGKRLNFLKRGSVLYPKDDEDSIKKLENYLNRPNYKKIGYNYYKIYSNKIEFTSQKGKEQEKE
jgi:CRISPR-associated protein Cmr3